MKSDRHMAQKGVQRHLECGFGIDSCSTLGLAAPLTQKHSSKLVILIYILTTGPGRSAKAQFANALERDRLRMQLREPLARNLELVVAGTAAGAARW